MLDVPVHDLPAALDRLLHLLWVRLRVEFHGYVNVTVQGPLEKRHEFCHVCVSAIKLRPLVYDPRQCKKMFSKTRRFACIFWLLMLVVTFALGLSGVDVGWVLLALVIQVCAGIWYSASYIPYGRRMIIKLFQGTCFAPCPQACDPVIKHAT